MHSQIRLKKPNWLLGLIGCGLAMVVSVHGQAPAVAGGPDAEILKSLLRRIDELETKAKRVDQLESQLSELKSRLVDTPTAAPATPIEKWPKLDMHVLGSLDFHASNAKDETKQFELGDIDIVTSAHLNEQASVTTDLVVASNHGGFSTEIERFVASYKFNDNFNLDLGRFHTAIGWYNNYYHNGTYFQTTQDRPEPFVFEDNGGLLPIHSVGVSLNGEIPSGSAGLGYSFEVANGRNYTSDEHAALDIADDNNYKAFNLQLRAKPAWLDSWQFGLGAYHDTLTPELAPGIKVRVDQLIFSSYAVYKTGTVEWFTEGFAIGDAVRRERRHWTGAAYTQVSNKFGPFRPYVRLQWRNAAVHDPLLELIGQNTSVWGPQIGVRYDFTTLMALKLELERSKYQHDPSVDEFTSQLTFRY